MKEELKEKDNSLKNIDNFTAEIEFKELTFAYDKEKIISNLNLKIEAGEIFALVGESGAGKSTLAHLLARLYDPDQGEVIISGRNIKDFSFEFLRRKIAVVPQDVYLFSTTVLENIRYANPDANKEMIEKICKMINADQFIKKMPQGYQTQVG